MEAAIDKFVEKKKQKEEEKNKNDEKKKKAATTPEDDNDMDPTEACYRQRYLDLKLHPESREIFIRAEILQYIRNFLKNNDFFEVETPMLDTIVGGAVAKPFVTYHNELDMDMEMTLRIAPELILKQLIVGGIERVFEIGKQSRNEGIDLTHNPEFTTCEFNTAYNDYNDLMVLTEQMLSGMAKELTGDYKIKFHSNGADKDPIEIDFTPPFRRIDMIEELERLTNLNIHKDFSSYAAKKYLLDACAKYNVACPPPQTNSRLLDKLVGHFLKETCQNPTFIMNHPQIMFPLAKLHISRPGLTEWCELFINKHTVCNAYTVQDDPLALRHQHLKEQLMRLQLGDDEALILDEDFCTILDYGLPPTAGCQLVLDRITKLFTDSQNIKNFPAMRSQVEPSSSKGSDLDEI